MFVSFDGQKVNVGEYTALLQISSLMARRKDFSKPVTVYKLGIMATLMKYNDSDSLLRLEVFG
jgi:hypothetical protein